MIDLRLGGPIISAFNGPADWVRSVKALNYSTVSCPAGPKSTAESITEFRAAAESADILIAEVGAWSNPISRDSAESAAALNRCQSCLALAEEIGAVCCVNITGSRGEKWDGPDPDNDSPETFDLIVESVRQIIDDVKPTRTFYTLEPMPWIVPDSPDSYLALIKAIDRKAFAVHLDPVNMINSPKRAYHTGKFLKECFAKLGPWIKCIHAKDIRFTQHLTVHLDECPPGTGLLNYRVLLQEIAKLPIDTPVLMEHMTTPEEYLTSAQFIRKTAAEVGCEIK